MVFNWYVEVGEIWAYRRQARNMECPVERVEISEREKSRFLVRFLDEDARQESVPRNRLITLWSDLDAWLADERRMEAVAGVSRHAEETPQYEAVEYVLEIWGLVNGVTIGWGPQEACSVQIDDLDAVCEALGLKAEELRAEPLAFTNRAGVFVAPWPAALKIAQRAVELNAESVINKVIDDEEELKLEAVHGQNYELPSGETGWISPERSADRRHRRQITLDVLRGWCGTKVIKRLDELNALRVEVRRLGRLVEQAIDELKKCGQDAIAAKMESDLGVPISRLAPPRPKRR